MYLINMEKEPILIPVFLSEEDAKLFVIFQKYYPIIKKIEEKKALDLEFGKCIINVAFGQAQNIIKEESFKL